MPKYLYYMVLELLKNSARATIETSSSQEEIEARPWLGKPWRIFPNSLESMDWFLQENLNRKTHGFDHEI